MFGLHSGVVCDPVLAMLFYILHQCNAVLCSAGLVPQAGTKLDIFAGCSYYSQILPPSGTKDAAILDMCSSWVSHYPKGYKLGRISGEPLALYRFCQPAPEYIVSLNWMRCMPPLYNIQLLYTTLSISILSLKKHCPMRFQLLLMCFQLLNVLVGRTAEHGWTSPQDV